MKQESHEDRSHHGRQIKVSLVPSSGCLRCPRPTPRRDPNESFRQGTGELTHPFYKGAALIRWKLERVKEVRGGASLQCVQHHKAADRTGWRIFLRELVVLLVLIALLTYHVAPDQDNPDGLFDGQV